MRMRVAAVTMETCLLFFCACADNQWHCCSSIKWVDQGVVYLFDYPAYSLIRPALEPRCPDNRGSTVSRKTPLKDCSIRKNKVIAKVWMRRFDGKSWI